MAHGTNRWKEVLQHQKSTGAISLFILYISQVNLQQRKHLFIELIGQSVSLAKTKVYVIRVATLRIGTKIICHSHTKSCPKRAANAAHVAALNYIHSGQNDCLVTNIEAIVHLHPLLSCSHVPYHRVLGQTHQRYQKNPLDDAWKFYSK